MDRHLAPLSPARAAVALAASFRLAWCSVAVGNPRPLTFPRCAGDCGLAVDADPPHLDLAGSAATSAGRGTGGPVAWYGSRLCRQLDRLRPGTGDYLKDRPTPPR